MEPTRDIVEGNLAKMMTPGEGNMPEIMLDKTIKPDPSSNQEKPCINVNFYFDKETGKILYFGRIEDVPFEIASANTRGTFQIAISALAEPRTRITEKSYYITNLDEISQIARLNLRESVHRYNHLINPQTE
jgi:hypothetical protein